MARPSPFDYGPLAPRFLEPWRRSELHMASECKPSCLLASQSLAKKISFRRCASILHFFAVLTTLPCLAVLTLIKDATFIVFFTL